MPWSLSAPVSLVRVVAAHWSLGTQLKAKPDHPYTFFGAKTAATFMQLNAELFHPAPADGACWRETKVIPLEIHRQTAARGGLSVSPRL
jgi:hypothetical protein